MPLQRCQHDGLPGWKRGKSGKCYTGGNAKARAAKQGKAIRASGFTGNVDSHRGVRTRVVPSNPLKADPTRSATLRRIFETDLTRRFFALKSKILRLIVDEDAFGLRGSRFVTLFNKEQSDGGSSVYLGGNNGGSERDQEQARLHGGKTGHNGKGTKADGKGVQVIGNRGGSPGGVVANQRWAALTNPQKVQAFQQWLVTQVQADIIATTAEGLDRAYWQQYVEEGYRKGAGRAFDDTRKVALSSDAQGVSDFYRGTREEFLRSAFAQPVAIEKVQLLTGRVFTDLKGVTEAMATVMTRTLADGLVQGDNPRKIARDLNRNIDAIGKRRAQLIARTEIIRAHSEGQLDAFENLGVEKVGVMAEWSTAGDDRVCPLCQPLEGTVMTVKEARGILPRHVQCRCAWIPANVGESKTEKRRVRFKDPNTGKVKTTFISPSRSKAEVQKSINDSIRAEIPKKATKRTLAQQKARTPWRGADKTIAKKRPRGILEGPEPVKKVRPRKVVPKRVTPTRVPVRTRRRAELEGLKSKELVRGSHHGQVDATFYVENPEGLPIAKIDYSELGESIHIEMIEVLAEFKRKGVSSEMFKRFLKENPKKKISWGMLTDKGAAFKASLERQGILKPIPSLAKTKPTKITLIKPRKVTPTPVKPVRVSPKPTPSVKFEADIIEKSLEVTRHLKNKHVRGMAEKAVQIALRKGDRVPEIIEHKFKGPFRAMYSKSQDKVAISRKLNAASERLHATSVERGWVTQENSVLHELGHAWHADNLGASRYDSIKNHFFTKSQRELIKREVSEYASKNAAEFVAEVYAGERSGKVYGTNVKDLFSIVSGGEL